MSIGPGVTRIKHLVIVIMENRSFDHMLGYLSVPPPNAAGRGDVRGLSGTEVNEFKKVEKDKKGKETTVTVPVMVHPLHRTIFRECPGHGFEATSIQIGEDRQMKGFAQHFAAALEYRRKKDLLNPQEEPGAVMGYHTAAEVPVYDFLARNFAVFDHWFASVPGPTWPNRAFLYAGTSGGIFDNKPKKEARRHYRAKLPTHLFVHELDRAGVDFRVYRDGAVPWLRMFPAFREIEDGDEGVEAEPEGEQSGRERRQERREDRRDRRHGRRRRLVEPLRHFDRDCRRDKLAPVVFVDPNFNIRGKNMLASRRNSDDQPPCDVSEGQRFVGEVYESIREAGLFDRTLLLVVYDEHGGFHDHVTPPDVPAAARERFKDDTVEANLSRYGVRVPALAASGWIPAGMVATDDFDHASIARTVLLWFCTRDGVTPSLGPRVDRARDVGAVLRMLQPRSNLPSARDAIRAAERQRSNAVFELHPDDDAIGEEIEELGLLERARRDEED